MFNSSRRSKLFVKGKLKMLFLTSCQDLGKTPKRFIFLKRKLKIRIFSSLPGSWQGMNLCFVKENLNILIFNSLPRKFFVLLCYGTENSGDISTLSFLYQELTQFYHIENVKCKWKMFFLVSLSCSISVVLQVPSTVEYYVYAGFVLAVS